MNQVDTKSDSVISGNYGTTFVCELEHFPEVADALRNFSSQEKCLLLDSSRSVDSAKGKPLGNFTFLTANPLKWFESATDSAQPFSELEAYSKRIKTSRIESLPPFQGGFAGVLSYDLNRSLERIAPTKSCEFPFPALAVGLYDTVVAWDHSQARCWIVSHGLDADGNPCEQRAKNRVEQFKSILLSDQEISPSDIEKPTALSFEYTPTPTGLEGLLSNFSKADYLKAVEQAIEYIYAGDVFQINLAQQLLYPANCAASELYVRLRRCNPAPFGGYFDLGDSQIVSASPERLISVRDRIVETRPIKGTRKRTRFPEVDLHSKQELKNSEKDRAENTMIVDLMRNDLSRVCMDNSIWVSQLCELEQYESVLHLVSAVQGKLRPEVSTFDLLKAIFPGGSITGAPKVRAMEIVAELEPTARGAYCGSMGYIGFDGTADFNILIRTITASQGWWQIPVGGGIVSQSKPQGEYEETWTKAAGMLRALRP